MKEITITKREEGQRFDKFLIKYLPGASSGFLHKMLRKKNIKLNGKKAEGREKLTAGDLIQIFFSDETLEKFQNRNQEEMILMRQTAVWEIIKVIEGLDSQDGIDSLTESRQKFIRKTEQAMEDKNENLRKKNENFVSRCVCFILQKIFLYSISLPECFLKEPKPVMIP